MNQVTDLRAELVCAYADFEAHCSRYSFCKGYGTGWKGSHYGISQDEYDDAYDRATYLRRRILAIKADIARRKKPGRMRASMVRV